MRRRNMVVGLCICCLCLCVCVRLGVKVIRNSSSNSKDYRKQCNSNSNIIEIFGEKE